MGPFLKRPGIFSSPKTCFMFAMFVFSILVDKLGKSRRLLEKNFFKLVKTEKFESVEGSVDPASRS